MGVLLDPVSGRRISLGWRSLVGRSPTCDVRVDDLAVSAEHAAVYWRGSEWELHELGSRNGTWVDGDSLPAGGRATLRTGSVIAIGRTSLVWYFVDDGPPEPSARNVVTGAIVRGASGLLAVPDVENPLLTVYAKGDAWELEEDGRSRSVSDGETVQAANEDWVLELPGGGGELAETAPESRGRYPLRSIGMRFEVSRDQEHVVASLVIGPVKRQLQARAYHELLLLLARARLDDRGRGIAEEECGWVYGDDLAKMLAVEPTKMNVDIFRARQQLQTEGIMDAALLVERRSTTRQLRIGVSHLEVGEPAGQ